MKKLFCFITVFVAFIAIALNAYNANAFPTPDKFCPIYVGPGDSLDEGKPEVKLVSTGIEATLHERRSGDYILNGEQKYEKWDIYVKLNSEGRVDYRDVSNLFLVSYLGTAYPIEGYAEYLNGIVDIQTPRFRVLESKEHFFSGRYDYKITKVDDYDVFVTPGAHAVVHFQDGSKDTNFLLGIASNADMRNLTYLIYRFEPEGIRYYRFKASEVGTASMITSGSILSISINDLTTKVSQIFTKFNSASELNKTTQDHYYYIDNVLLID